MEETSVVKPACGKRTRRKGTTRPRMSDAEFSVLGFGQQGRLLEMNYKKTLLKKMCSHYGIRVGGNKDELQKRVFDFLKRSQWAAVLQGAWRRRLVKRCASLRGPAFLKRSLSVNETDFYSMTPCADIPTAQFFSVRDQNDCVYVFDILSISTLFGTRGRDSLNPYNRQPFPKGTHAALKELVRLSRAAGHHVATKPPPPPMEEMFEQRCGALFHDIYLLGHYPAAAWFSRLPRALVVRYLRELQDIWQYRAQLDRRTKKDICPPDGEPFRQIGMPGIGVRPEASLRQEAITVMSRMVRDGVSGDSRKLGAFYVLCALTLVSPEAAASMPALHAAVVPENV